MTELQVGEVGWPIILFMHFHVCGLSYFYFATPLLFLLFEV